MVDQEVPTNQFHPYQPPTAIPHREEEPGRWDVLRKAGLSDSRIESIRSRAANIHLDRSWNRFRDYARQNPGKVLGGLAALVIGASLLGGSISRRRHREAPEI